MEHVFFWPCLTDASRIWASVEWNLYGKGTWDLQPIFGPVRSQTKNVQNHRLFQLYQSPVGGFKHLDYFPFHLWDVILPIDELIFFKMVIATPTSKAIHIFFENHDATICEMVTSFGQHQIWFLYVKWWNGQLENPERFAETDHQRILGGDRHRCFPSLKRLRITSAAGLYRMGVDDLKPQVDSLNWWFRSFLDKFWQCSKSIEQCSKPWLLLVARWIQAFFEDTITITIYNHL